MLAPKLLPLFNVRFAAAPHRKNDRCNLSRECHARNGGGFAASHVALKDRMKRAAPKRCVKRNISKHLLEQWLPNSQANAAGSLLADSFAIRHSVFGGRPLDHSEATVRPKRTQRPKPIRLACDRDDLCGAHLADVRHCLQDGKPWIARREIQERGPCLGHKYRGSLQLPDVRPRDKPRAWRKTGERNSLWC